MSFAPEVDAAWCDRLPGAVHIDGSARVQTVTPEQDGWLYRLLKLVGEAAGHEVILNTSFNRRNRPIINSIREAVALLETTPELAHVLVEDVLFSQ